MYNFYNYTSAHSETSDGRKQVLVVPDPSAHLMVPRDGLGALSARVEYTHPCEWVAHMHAQAKREGEGRLSVNWTSRRTECLWTVGQRPVDGRADSSTCDRSVPNRSELTHATSVKLSSLMNTTRCGFPAPAGAPLDEGGDGCCGGVSASTASSGPRLRPAVADVMTPTVVAFWSMLYALMSSLLFSFAMNCRGRQGIVY